MANRINSRRIYYLGTEVTKLRCLYITQFVNGISGRNHTRICSHETIHIRPDFQLVGIQCRRNNRSCIIGTTTPQVRNISCHLISRDEPRYQCTLRQSAECFTNQFIRQLCIQYILGVLLFSFDELARIKPLGSSQLCNDNGR